MRTLGVGRAPATRRAPGLLLDYSKAGARPPMTGIMRWGRAGMTFVMCFEGRLLPVPVLDRQQRRLRAVGHPQFRQHTAHQVAHRALGQVQVRSDLAVRSAVPQ